jgi:hypothetical protein
MVICILSNLPLYILMTWFCKMTKGSLLSGKICTGIKGRVMEENPEMLLAKPGIAFG